MATIAWKNWRASLERHEPGSPDFETVLYSDASFRGEHLTLGPYKVITTGPDPAPMMPSLVVRGETLIEFPDLIDQEAGGLAPANSEAYHGGTSIDEIAALLSLSCGVRCRAGGTSRIWNIRQDPYGSPVYWDMHPVRRPGPPNLEVLPLVSSRQATLADVDSLLQKFPRISADNAVALIRAARLYSNGLWWANEDPNFAWLQFVGAVEVVANTRRLRNPRGPEALAALEEFAPGLWRALTGADDSVKERVARETLHAQAATRKFLSLVEDFVQEPPQPRPNPFAQVDWNDMRSHMRIVYGHRNNALHAGTPFPQPMLQKPYFDAENGLSERPLGMSAGGRGGSWVAHEFPLTLQTFEHIVRDCLKTWWQGLPEGQ